MQQVLAQTSTTLISPEEAFETIDDFGLSEREGGALEAFSLTSQGNLALLRQHGFGNGAVLDQRGTGNLAVLLQLGNANLTTAQQIGTGNMFGVRLVGDENRLNLLQHGTDNVYLLNYVGDGLSIAPIIQSGSENQAVQVGLTVAPFGVQQYGNGMRMIISHNGAR